MTGLVAAADEPCENDPGDAAEPRSRRDTAAAGLGVEVVEILDTLTSMFGAALVKEIGIDSRVEPDSQTVLARAKRARRPREAVEPAARPGRERRGSAGIGEQRRGGRRLIASAEATKRRWGYMGAAAE